MVDRLQMNKTEVVPPVLLMWTFYSVKRSFCLDVFKTQNIFLFNNLSFSS